MKSSSSSSYVKHGIWETSKLYPYLVIDGNDNDEDPTVIDGNNNDEDYEFQDIIILIILVLN